MNILYYYSKLGIGGAEKSTIRLVNKFIERGHSVTMLLRWDGPLDKSLDKNIKILYLKKSFFKKKFPGSNILDWLLNTLLLPIRKKQLNHQEFDIAINGLLGYDPSLLFYSISAKIHAQMLRSDVEKTGNYGKTKQYMRDYGDCFDLYFGVSKYVTDTFKHCYPGLSSKAYTLYNIIPEIDNAIKYDIPKEMAKVNQLRILTVCRLQESSKGLCRMVDVAHRLKQEKLDDFKWYIVGDGPDRQLLQEKIKKERMNDVFVLCGRKENPIPYYQHCDAVAVFSCYEGLCGVINEAKMMCKPVLATRFSGIDEQIINGSNGLIFENTLEGIVSGMSEMLRNPSILKMFNNNGLPIELIDNDVKMQKFEEICQSIDK